VLVKNYFIAQFPGMFDGGYSKPINTGRTRKIDEKKRLEKREKYSKNLRAFPGSATTGKQYPGGFKKCVGCPRKNATVRDESRGKKKKFRCGTVEETQARCKGNVRKVGDW